MDSSEMGLLLVAEREDVVWVLVCRHVVELGLLLRDQLRARFWIEE